MDRNLAHRQPGILPGGVGFHAQVGQSHKTRETVPRVMKGRVRAIEGKALAVGSVLGLQHPGIGIRRNSL